MMFTRCFFSVLGKCLMKKKNNKRNGNKTLTESNYMGCKIHKTRIMILGLGEGRRGLKVAESAQKSRKCVLFLRSGGLSGCGRNGPNVWIVCLGVAG